MITVDQLSKSYGDGTRALNDVSLEIEQGEILALLGPNGAGKTTLISIICGLVTPTSGRVTVGGYDIIKEYRKARSLIGLVPQELPTDAFDTPWNSLRLSRGLFGKRPDPDYLEKGLRDLSLWDKRESRIMTLSGGMKRRLLIAKALCHEPKILFLDEPTAGVDVELRQDMWRMMNLLSEQGVTIILTTHYIEEAEAIADRVGVINDGQLLLVECKETLIKKMGQKCLYIDLIEAIQALPESLARFGLELLQGGWRLAFRYSRSQDSNTNELSADIPSLLQEIAKAGLTIKDFHTEQSTLEDIFVSLVREPS